MTSQASLRLSTVSEEIASIKADLSRLRERLDVQRAELDEHRLRMLMAETPLADRDLHAAAESYLRIEEEVHRLEGALESLRLEQQLLGRALAAAGT